MQIICMGIFCWMYLIIPVNSGAWICRFLFRFLRSVFVHHWRKRHLLLCRWKTSLVRCCVVYRQISLILVPLSSEIVIEHAPLFLDLFDFITVLWIAVSLSCWSFFGKIVSKCGLREMLNWPLWNKLSSCLWVYLW